MTRDEVVRVASLFAFRGARAEFFLPPLTFETILSRDTIGTEGSVDARTLGQREAAVSASPVVSRPNYGLVPGI